MNGSGCFLYGWKALCTPMLVVVVVAVPPFFCCAAASSSISFVELFDESAFEEDLNEAELFDELDVSVAVVVVVILVIVVVFLLVVVIGSYHGGFLFVARAHLVVVLVLGTVGLVLFVVVVVVQTRVLDLGLVVVDTLQQLGRARRGLDAARRVELVCARLFLGLLLFVALQLSGLLAFAYLDR